MMSHRSPMLSLRAAVRAAALTAAATISIACGSTDDGPEPLSSSGRPTDRLELRATVLGEEGGALSARAQLFVAAGDSDASSVGRPVRLEGGDVLRVAGVALTSASDATLSATVALSPRATVDVTFERPSRAPTTIAVALPAPFELTAPAAGATIRASEGVRFAWSAPFDRATTRQFLVQGECLVDDLAFPVGLAEGATSHTTGPLRMRAGQELASCEATVSIVVGSGAKATGFAPSSVLSTGQRRSARVTVVP